MNKYLQQIFDAADRVEQRFADWCQAEGAEAEAKHRLYDDEKAMLVGVIRGVREVLQQEGKNDNA